MTEFMDDIFTFNDGAEEPTLMEMSVWEEPTKTRAKATMTALDSLKAFQQRSAIAVRRESQWRAEDDSQRTGWRLQ